MKNYKTACKIISLKLRAYFGSVFNKGLILILVLISVMKKFTVVWKSNLLFKYYINLVWKNPSKLIFREQI